MRHITEISSKVEPVTFVEDELELSFRYWYGEHYGRFYAELRDNRRILGMRCEKCGSVLLPPRPYCGFCHAPLRTWVELSDKGAVDTFSIVHTPNAKELIETPYACAMIKLDGCDVPLYHLLGEVEFKDILTGMRVTAVWEEVRKGALRDIRYFRPSEQRSIRSD
ncbi:MAG: Zn-ribbon domain-containing OB-fold protein [Actinobacteria bacterium]|nr:Zn-ribbon domain-containing OB-fold protein [Actinomycetota bacterium]